MAKQEYSELLPPKGKEGVAQRVFEILDEVLEYKKDLGLPDKWTRHHELIKNEHYKTPVEVPTVSLNLCHVHQQRTVNMLTDSNPTFDVAQLQETDDGQASEEDIQAFEMLQKAAGDWWTDQEQQDILEDSIRNGETYGIAIEKVIYNAQDKPLGEVETIVVDPFHFGWYPTRSIRNPRDLQKAAAVLHFYPRAIRDLKREYPDFADKIKPDTDVLKRLEDNRKEGKGVDGDPYSPKKVMTSIIGKIAQLYARKSAQEIDTEEALVCEFWCRDYSTKSKGKKDAKKAEAKDQKEVKQEEEVGVDWSEAAYRGNIRKVVAINGETVLEDRGNPNVNDDLDDEKAQMTYLFDKYPFSAANSIKDSFSAWGRSDLEQLGDLNREANKSLSQLVLEKDRVARKKIINPLTSGVSSDQFTNYFGVIRPVNAEEANAIRWLAAPTGEADINAAVTMFKDLFFLVAGTFEMDQKAGGGNSGGDVIAYKALAILQERNQTMMRGKTRSYGRLIRDRGRMFISMVQNFYDTERFISYEDTNGIKVAKKFTGTDLIIPCRLTVVSGSTLPQSNVQKREEAMNLFEKGAVDRPQLLQELNVAGRKEIIDRMAAGPVGQVMSALGTLGVPQPLLQIFSQIAVMDPKEIQKGIKSGEIPPFQEFLQQMMQALSGQPAPEQQIPPLEQADIAVKQAEVQVKTATVQKLMAEAQKVIAENALLAQQVESEKVGQRVSMAGVHFDNRKLQMEQARTVNDITMARRAGTPVNLPGSEKAAADIMKAEPKTPEIGAVPGVPTPRPPGVSVTPSPIPEQENSTPPPIAQDESALPAGYNEAGMSSNNEGNDNLDTDIQED